MGIRPADSGTWQTYLLKAAKYVASSGAGQSRAVVFAAPDDEVVEVGTCSFPQAERRTANTKNERSVFISDLLITLYIICISIVKWRQ